MRSQHTRIIRRTLLTVVVLAAMVAVNAMAGDPLGLRMKHKKPHGRLTKEARYSFVNGELRQGRHGTWELADGTRLQLSPTLIWREEKAGQTGYPSSGRQVQLMGQRRGSEFLVRQAKLVSRQRQIQGLQMRPVTEPGEPEPNEPD